VTGDDLKQLQGDNPTAEIAWQLGTAPRIPLWWVAKVPGDKPNTYDNF